MSLTADPRDGLRKIENLLDNKHMKDTNTSQTSTPDADFCGELRTMSGPGVTPNERATVEALAEAWNLFMRLDGRDYEMDRDFRQSINRAQDIIAYRVASRVDPDLWRQLPASQPSPAPPPPLRGRPGVIDLLRKVTGDQIAAPADVEECQSAPSATPRPDAELRDEAYRRTDAIVAYSANGRPWPGYYIPLAKHIELERELAEARADARRQRGLATKYMLERNDARYDLGEARELIAVKDRSLHAASAAIHDINQSMVGALRFIDEVREQRDQMADALREIASGLHDWKTCVDRIAPKAIAVTSSPLTIKTDEQLRD